MIANTVKELPMTLANIKGESREDEFIQSIKNKIHNKDPNVPGVFCDDVLQTDHKPLITIFGSKKCLQVETANRLLRWGTILLNYNFNDRVVIPKSLQRKILRDFHMRHPGKNCYVYWPDMDRDIAGWIKSCKGCALAAKSPTTMCKQWPNVDSFHGKRSSRKPSRPIRNISIQAIESFSRPTKTTLYSWK